MRDGWQIDSSSRFSGTHGSISWPWCFSVENLTSSFAVYTINDGQLRLACAACRSYGYCGHWRGNREGWLKDFVTYELVRWFQISGHAKRTWKGCWVCSSRLSYTQHADIISSVSLSLCLAIRILGYDMPLVIACRWFFVFAYQHTLFTNSRLVVSCVRTSRWDIETYILLTFANILPGAGGHSEEIPSKFVFCAYPRSRGSRTKASFTSISRKWLPNFLSEFMLTPLLLWLTSAKASSGIRSYLSSILSSNDFLSFLTLELTSLWREDMSRNK